MSSLHALLIGIDAYLPNHLPEGGTYPQLRGCVRDVSRVEEFLRTSLGVPAERILKLTASLPPDAGLAVTREPGALFTPEALPTYANIVAAFQRITEAAGAGDEVYVHYSGHGGRAKTIYPEKKGEGFDEALVPVDIGDSGRYLRDLEIAKILEEMIAKKLRVLLVFDSCHSGGAVRNEYRKRGAFFPSGKLVVDSNRRLEDSLVAPREALLAAWKGKPPEPVPPTPPGGVVMRGEYNLRDAFVSDEWLPGAKDFVLLAACREQESAFERIFDGEMCGALTHWLLEALRRRGPGWTYKDLHKRVVAQVHGDILQQTPMLLGEGDWLVFGGGAAVRQSGVTVLTVEPDGRLLLLNTGQAQGIVDGARFALYPLGASPNDPAGRIAMVEIRGFGATESWAEVVGELRTAIEPGAQAFLLDLETEGRLAHLARYRRVREIENFDPVSPLAAALRVEFLGVQAGYHRGERPAPRPGTAATGSIELEEGEWTFLRITNRSGRVLNVFVLDLKTDWGITQIYPAANQGSFLPLDGGKELVLPVRGDLPSGLDEANDLLKVIATVGTADFHWLELPPLGPAEVSVAAAAPETPAVRQGGVVRSATLPAAASGTGASRGITPSAFPSEEWVTAQVEMRVRRAPAPAGPGASSPGAEAGTPLGRSWRPSV